MVNKGSMVFISPGQCRAARALLCWSQRQLEERSGISKKAIADFERGASDPYARTLKGLVETFEEAGILFLPEGEGAQAGVALKLGVEEPRPGTGGDDADETETGGHRKLSSPLDVELTDYWRERPEQWAKFSESGRHVLSNMMFGSPEAADEAFGNGPGW
jgi:transcriptional regulator with XRE-family HTH domain